MGEIDDTETPDEQAAAEALIPQKGQALAVFGSAVKVDELLERVVNAAKARIPADADMTVAKDRDAVRGAARFVASSKVALDKAGLQLTSDMRAAVARVNAERARITDELTARQAEIRRPLTDWETAEIARKAALEQRMQAFLPGLSLIDAASIEVADEIRRVQAIVIDETWDERTAEAGLRKDAVLADLRKTWAAADQRERDAAELARLRAAEAAREAAEAEAEQKRLDEEAAAERKRQADEAEANRKKAEADRLAQIEREKAAAADRARKDAEDAAAARIAAAEAETAKAAELARSMAIAAQKERDEAAAKAVRDQAAAVDAERKRAADERRRNEETIAKAAASKAKRAKARALIVAAIDKVLAMKDPKNRPPAELIADALMTPGIVPHVRYEP